MAEELISTTTISRWFDVGIRTVRQWINRYPDFPAPDIEAPQRGRVSRAWLPHREPEIRAWYENRPGQGSRTDL